jgi:hypothetical protein
LRRGRETAAGEADVGTEPVQRPERGEAARVAALFLVALDRAELTRACRAASAASTPDAIRSRVRSSMCSRISSPRSRSKRARDSSASKRCVKRRPSGLPGTVLQRRADDVHHPLPAGFFLAQPPPSGRRADS